MENELFSEWGNLPTHILMYLNLILNTQKAKSSSLQAVSSASIIFRLYPPFVASITGCFWVKCNFKVVINSYSIYIALFFQIKPDILNAGVCLSLWWSKWNSLIYIHKIQHVFGIMGAALGEFVFPLSQSYVADK